MREAYGTGEVKVEVPIEEEFEKNMSARFMQAEIRNRNLWKQDIQAAFRGQLNDLMSHVESRASELVEKEVIKQLRPYQQEVRDSIELSRKQVKDALERSQQQLASNNARVQADRADFTKSIEDTVAGIVLKLLREYWLLDSENRVLDSNQRPA